MAGFNLLSRDIPAVYDLNWRFLILLLVAGILIIFFLFYFNRLIASILSYSLRLYIWRTYQVYLDIKSIQFSLLAGRVFFKGLQYHGQNETISVTDGYITWRYWLRRVKEVDCNKGVEVRKDSDSAAEVGSAPQEVDAENHNVRRKVDEKLPCRIEIRFRGLEWFIYNRGPAYETVLESLLQTPRPSTSSPGNSRLSRRARFDCSPEGKTRSSEKGIIHGYEDNKADGESTKSTEDGSDLGSRTSHEKGEHAKNRSQKVYAQFATLPAWIRFLPIGIQCSKLGIVLGNTETRTVLTAKCERLDGQIGAKASGPLDLYKQIIELDITHPLIQFKNNKLYKGTEIQLAAATSNLDLNVWERSVRLPHLLGKMLHGLVPERMARRLGGRTQRSLNRSIDGLVLTDIWMRMMTALSKNAGKL